MTTAREQARTALRARFENMERGDYPPGEFDYYLADAASDVWEPLLRDLIENKYHDMKALVCPACLARQRAKEALGD